MEYCHKIMEIMEESEIPEGLYLRVAEQLKKITDDYSKMCVITVKRDPSQRDSFVEFITGYITGTEYIVNPSTGRLIRRNGRLARAIIGQVFN